MLTLDQFRLLLNESESSSLDFKQAQYKFVGATDEEKGELLKDILAFANSFRRTDAYVLIGVSSIKEIVGIADDIDDAQLQQFVNSKTQRQVDFLYYSIECNGKKVGIIRVPIQPRPLYLQRDFGKLRKGVVYLRRGSSTGEATPDEIVQMGSGFEIKEEFKPFLDVVFPDGSNVFQIHPKDLKRTITDKAKLLEQYKNKYPLVETPVIRDQAMLPEIVQAMASIMNSLQHASPQAYNSYLSECYDEYEKYLDHLSTYENDYGYIFECPMELRNSGTAPAEDVDVFLHFPNGLNLYDRHTLPERPETPTEPVAQDKFSPKTFNLLDTLSYINRPIPHISSLNIPPPNVSSPSIKKTHSYEVHFSIAKVKHNQAERLRKLFLEIPRDSKPASFLVDYRINADNIPQEIKGQLSIQISSE